MYLIFKIAIKIVDLKQTTRYFSSKYGHIWEHQRIIIWGLQPWWPTYRPSGSSAEGEHFIKEGEEAERPVVNNVSLAFHPLSLAETEEDSLLPVGLCCHCKPWELPLLVSSLYLIEDSVYQFSTGFLVTMPFSLSVPRGTFPGCSVSCSGKSAQVRNLLNLIWVTRRASRKNSHHFLI